MPLYVVAISVKFGMYYLFQECYYRMIFCQSSWRDTHSYNSLLSIEKVNGLTTKVWAQFLRLRSHLFKNWYLQWVIPLYHQCMNEQKSAMIYIMTTSVYYTRGYMMDRPFFCIKRLFSINVFSFSERAFNILK